MPLANISIPSNLQEILATLQNAGTTRTTTTSSSSIPAAKEDVADEDDDYEEYNPLPVSSKLPSESVYKPRPDSPSTKAFLLAQQQPGEEIPFITGSKLSHMTDAELMSLVPDGVDLPPVELSLSGGGGNAAYDPNE